MLKINSSNGFTLIEVLIAVIVLAMGLLGFAALQALTLKNSQSSYYRSVATQLAYDITDRMRANKGAANQYLSDPKNATAQAACTTTTGCTSPGMAENDLSEWQLGLNTLPLGSGSVAVSGNVYTVTITWDDNRNGLNDDDNFDMSFSL